jgi:transcriptional regulator with XRE-family HTH domain
MITRDAVPAAGGRGPVSVRITLGRRLRDLRERSHVTREAAGDAIRGSAAKISRLELGRVGFKERDVTDLLALYGVGADEAAQLLALVRSANEPPWWNAYSDLLPPWFTTFLGLEQAATLIRSFECQFVPGLLQTADYARAVTRLGYEDEAVVERRVELRLRRQALLDAPDAPVLWAVLDQAVLSQLVRDPVLGKAQLAHLLEMSERSNVQLQVAGFEHGSLPAAGGAFTIMRFASGEVPDVVYLEQLTTSLFLEKRSDVEHYVGIMNALVALVHTPDATRDLIRRLHDAL